MHTLRAYCRHAVPLMVAAVLSIGCESTPTDPGLPPSAARACYEGPPDTRGVGICRGGVELLLPNTFGAAAFACHGQVLPRAETCNQLDDDCNGIVDDGEVCPQPCYSGPPGTEGVGECRAGLHFRLAPFATEEDETCHGEVLPREETCNGRDDDCNGVVDDGEVCPHPCYTGPPGTEGVGRCKGGLRFQLPPFTSPADEICHGEVLPRAERCNGEDDDCDGVVDNVIAGGCGGSPGGPGGGVGGGAGGGPVETWLADRTGPAHLYHPYAGALAVCLPEDTPTGCAVRTLHKPSLAPRYGLVDGSHRTIVAAGEVSMPRAKLTVVRLEQRHRGVPVDQGQVRVTVALDSPMRVATVSSLLRPVPVSLDVQPTLSPADLELSEGLDPADAELVVWVSYEAADGPVLAAPEQVAALAWRLTGEDETVFFSATGGDVLERRQEIIEDVWGTDLETGEIASAMCHAQGSSLQCPWVELGPVPSLLDTAVFGVQVLHHWLWERIGRDGIDGEGDQNPPVRAWVNVPCSGNSLGWSSAAHPVVLCTCQPEADDCSPPFRFPDGSPNYRRAYGTAVHEGLHHLHRTMTITNTSSVEGEAVEHAFVEAVVQLMDCAEESHPVDRPCDFLGTNGNGRHYTGAPVDPSKQGSSCCGSGALGGCIAPLMPPTSGVEPAFSLCPATDAGKPHTQNRRALGNALVNATCRMAGCTPAECTQGLAASCAAPEPLRDASRRMLAVVWTSVPQQSGWTHHEAALSLVATAQHLRNLSQLTLHDVTSIHAALAQVGLLKSGISLPFELCDGHDNDGDGFVDNAPGTSANYTLTRPCYSGAEAQLGVGPCVHGVEACGPGGWTGECEGEVLPSDEVCNGFDDNCDGQTDEGLLIQYGYDADGDGYAGLAPPQWACPDELGPGFVPLGPTTVGDCDDSNPAVHPGAEERCDTPWDDNCDGIINEGCPCTHWEPPLYCGPSVGHACLGQPVGTPGCDASLPGSPYCSLGLTTCVFTANQTWEWADVCKGAQLGTAEVCNGLDDDCDGVVDNDVTGLSASCGVYGTGEEVCSGGAVICAGQSQVNACGGLGTLALQPGSDCTPPGSYAHYVAVCAGLNQTVCLPNGQGECGGGPLVDHVPAVTTSFHVPPLVQGSPEADGGNVNLEFRMYLTLQVHVNRVDAILSMYGKSANSSKSTIDSTGAPETFTLLEYPPGCLIHEASFTTSPNSKVELPPTKYGVGDTHVVSPTAGPAAQFHFVADTAGVEFGTETGFRALLHPFTVTVCCP